VATLDQTAHIVQGVIASGFTGLQTLFATALKTTIGLQTHS